MDLAITSILEEIERLTTEAVSDDDLADNQSYFTGRMPLRLESNEGIASHIHSMESFDLGLDYLAEYDDMIYRIEKEDLLRRRGAILAPPKWSSLWPVPIKPAKLRMTQAPPDAAASARAQLLSLKNLGPRSAEKLLAIGIRSRDDIARMGAVEVYLRLLERFPGQPDHVMGAARRAAGAALLSDSGRHQRRSAA